MVESESTTTVLAPGGGDDGGDEAPVLIKGLTFFVLFFAADRIDSNSVFQSRRGFTGRRGTRVGGATSSLRPKLRLAFAAGALSGVG